eukprot:11807776-Alexandrium_andersonii.AAC.1
MELADIAAGPGSRPPGHALDGWLRSVGWNCDRLSPADAERLLARWHAERQAHDLDTPPRALAPWTRAPPRPGRYWRSGRQRFKKTEPVTGVRTPDGRWASSPPE